MNMKRKKTGEKGFTLVELLVVMSILAVLSAMVFPTVTGMKTSGETTAAKGDAKSVSDAVNTFNSQSRSQAFPETAIACDFASGSQPVTLTLNSKLVRASSSTTTDASAFITSGLALGLGMSLCTADGNLTTHTQIDWPATTYVRQEDGSVLSLKFIPDFLPSKPKSALLSRGGYDEFIWLFLKGTTQDFTGRTFQALRLNAGGTAYEVVRD